MRILIVSRNTWDDSAGISSTLSNLFEGFNPDEVAHLYIETKQPNTRHCNHFYQISEFGLIKRLYKWNYKTGHAFDADGKLFVDESAAAKEESTFSYVRGHRSFFLSIAREILWLLNGWRTKELRRFLVDFNPDVVWLDGSPLVLMNKLYQYVLKVTQKPAAIFLMDDVYTYESCGSFSQKVYKFWLRKHVRRVVKSCKKVFVISPKMKREYDELFAINSTILTKGIIPIQDYSLPEVHKPIRLVYLGQIMYGRLDTIVQLVNSLKEVNKDAIKVVFSIYTNNEIPLETRDKWQSLSFVHVEKPVPYSEVPNVISQNDILLFVESFQKEQKSVARLSFSTKITDYLASGKCIMGIGPSDIAPIEYLREEDAAIIVSDLSKITGVLNGLSEEVVRNYARKSYELGKKNHSKERVQKIITEGLQSIALM